MRKFVVAHLDFFNNNLTQVIIEAENEYEAVKQRMLDLCSKDGYGEELEWQKSEDYPKTFEELEVMLINSDTAISVLELQ